MIDRLPNPVCASCELETIEWEEWCCLAKFKTLLQSATAYISLRAGSQRPPLQGSPGFFSALIRRLFSLARLRLIEQNA